MIINFHAHHSPITLHSPCVGVGLRHSILLAVDEMTMNKIRPKHLALHKIKLPLPGIVSILHRVSGALLFIALPLLLFILDQSLRSIETYTNLTEVLAYPILKLALLGLMWAFLHHFCAGLRYLAIDLHLLSHISAARASSKWVMLVSLSLTIVLGVKLW
jgi:succinate dehydrogenase / fumarate reductase cytochrome b subunit